MIQRILASRPTGAGVIASIPETRAEAAGLGVVRSVSDDDGTVRTVPMVWATQGGDSIHLWPAFSMELVRLHQQFQSYALRFTSAPPDVTIRP